MTDNDQDLRDRFARLRREEEARVPAFATFLRPSPKPALRRKPGLFIVATACLALTIAAILGLRPLFRSPHPEPGNQAASISEWKPPTSFLLDTPGRTLLTTVPAIGAWPQSPMFPPPAHKHRQAAKQAMP